MKEWSSEAWLILEMLGIFGLLGVLCVFFRPANEDGFKVIITILGTTLSTIVVAKYARKMPEQIGDARPGQSSQSETITRSTAAPAPVAPPPVP